MNIHITADGLCLSPSIEAHVRDKLTKVLGHFDHAVTAHVTLSIEKTKDKSNGQCASCKIHTKGADLFAKTASQDLYTTIDDLMEKMDGLVRKHKGKSNAHRGRQKEAAQTASAL